MYCNFCILYQEEGIRSEDDIDSCPEDNTVEPIKPKKPKVSILEALVKEELSDCLRPPGEPSVEVYLLEDLNITLTTEHAM